MTGQLIYVVGPSGSGKDSIIQALLERLEVTVMRRVITRPSDSIGEASDSVEPETFEQMEEKGMFSMSWHANGLSYGIPFSLDHYLQDGKTVIVNGSREYCEVLHEKYPDALLVLVTVEHELLRQRLEQRNRETMQEIELRLQRNQQFEKRFLANVERWQLPFFILDNSMTLEQTVAQFYEQLEHFQKGSEVMIRNQQSAQKIA